MVRVDLGGIKIAISLNVDNITFPLPYEETGGTKVTEFK